MKLQWGQKRHFKQELIVHMKIGEHSDGQGVYLLSPPLPCVRPALSSLLFPSTPSHEARDEPVVLLMLDLEVYLCLDDAGQSRIYLPPPSPPWPLAV